MSHLSPEPKPPATASVKNVIRASAGNMLEMYDFMVFGFYAGPIGQHFFPSHSAVISLLAAFATFGVGFVMRPIGAIVLGGYIDKHGRRKGLLLTLALMALGTVTIAFTPGYAAIGVAAPLLILLGRLVQGFSAGAELGAVSVYLSEIATPRTRGFVTSFQSCSQQVAVILAALVGFGLSSWLTPAASDNWGWRVPFMLGCAIVPLLLLLRRGLEETAAFTARHQRPSLPETLRIMRREWKLIVRGMLLVAMTTVSFYTITAYTPTFGHEVLHLSTRDALLVTLAVGVSNFVLLPLGGMLSDHIGRRNVLIGCCMAACLLAYPAMRWLVGAPSFGRLLDVELLLSLIYALYNGALIAFLTELMPHAVRVTAFSLAYSLATAVFGGFTPYLCTQLIRASGNQAMPALSVTAAAVIALLALVGLPPQRRSGPAHVR